MCLWVGGQVSGEKTKVRFAASETGKTTTFLLFTASSSSAVFVAAPVGWVFVEASGPIHAGSGLHQVKS